MKNLIPFVLSLLFAVGSMNSLQVKEANADVLITLASLGLYPILLSKNSGRDSGEMLTTKCLDEALDHPAFSVVCPFAFILDDDGQVVLHQSSREYLLEQGLSEQEIIQIEGVNSAKLSQP